MQDDLQQQISQLGAKLLGIATLDRLDDLVSLLDDVRRERPVRLLAIPRAAARTAQPRDDLDQASECLAGAAGWSVVRIGHLAILVGARSAGYSHPPCPGKRTSSSSAAASRA